MLFPGLKRHKHDHIHYFRTLQGVFGMLRDPEHTESVFDIEDGLRDIKASRLAVDYVVSHPEIRALASERYLRPVPDVDELLRLPVGTLGFHYASHLRLHGFDPDYYRKIAVTSDADWAALRMRQTHDIWHVVTGISPDAIGELTLKACELAQTRRPMAAVITAGGVLRYLIHDPERLPDVMDGLAKGYAIGARAKPLLAQRWEDRWSEPLAAVREGLDVAAGTYLPSWPTGGTASEVADGTP